MRSLSLFKVAEIPVLRVHCLFSVAHGDDPAQNTHIKRPVRADICAGIMIVIKDPVTGQFLENDFTRPKVDSGKVPRIGGSGTLRLGVGVDQPVGQRHLAHYRGNAYRFVRPDRVTAITVVVHVDACDARFGGPSMGRILLRIFITEVVLHDDRFIGGNQRILIGGLAGLKYRLGAH